jgi:hypothetical protein
LELRRHGNGFYASRTICWPNRLIPLLPARQVSASARAMAVLTRVSLGSIVSGNASAM